MSSSLASFLESNLVDIRLCIAYSLSMATSGLTTETDAPLPLCPVTVSSLQALLDGIDSYGHSDTVKWEASRRNPSDRSTSTAGAVIAPPMPNLPSRCRPDVLEQLPSQPSAPPSAPQQLVTPESSSQSTPFPHADPSAQSTSQAAPVVAPAKRSSPPVLLERTPRITRAARLAQLQSVLDRPAPPTQPTTSPIHKPVPDAGQSAQQTLPKAGKRKGRGPARGPSPGQDDGDRADRPYPTACEESRGTKKKQKRLLDVERKTMQPPLKETHALILRMAEISWDHNAQALEDMLRDNMVAWTSNAQECLDGTITALQCVARSTYTSLVQNRKAQRIATYHRWLELMRLGSVVSRIMKAQHIKTAAKFYDLYLDPPMKPSAYKALSKDTRARYDKARAAAQRAFANMKELGIKWARVLQGVSFHGVFIFLSLELATEVARLNREAINDLARSFRAPHAFSDQGTSGSVKRAIVDRIWPVLARIRLGYPVPLWNRIFGPKLQEDDLFWPAHFQFLSLVLPPRDSELYERPMHDLPPQLPVFTHNVSIELKSSVPPPPPPTDKHRTVRHAPAPSNQRQLRSSTNVPAVEPPRVLHGLPSPQWLAPQRRGLRTFEIGLDLQNQSHAHAPFTKDERVAWTEQERAKADRAEPYVSVKRSIELLQSSFDDDGVRRTDGYVTFRSLPDDDLNCLGRNGTNIFYLSSQNGIPTDVKEQLWWRTLLIMNAPDIAINSEENSERFTAYHGSEWLKYGQVGPEGTKNRESRRSASKHVNSYLQGGSIHSRLPHLSQEVINNPERYTQCVQLLDPWVQYAVQTARERIKKPFEVLSAYVTQSPLHASLPAEPFTGFVVNVHACTLGHRDEGDPPEAFCVVIAFGDFEGGALCLFEAGVRLELKCGDMVMFPSHDITHFNLHFHGRRGSFVLHGDHSRERYVKYNNGWALE